MLSIWGEELEHTLSLTVSSHERIIPFFDRGWFVISKDIEWNSVEQTFMPVTTLSPRVRRMYFSNLSSRKTLPQREPGELISEMYQCPLEQGGARTGA